MRPLFLHPLPRLIPAPAARAIELIWSLVPHGITPRGARQLRLWQGIEAHDPLLVERALASGADARLPLARLGRPNHPIGEAIHQRWLGGSDGLRVLTLLLGAGADPNTELLDRSAPCVPAPSGEPCLLRALRLGEMPSCLALLDHGANPDLIDSRGWGPAPPLPAGHALSARSFAQAHAGAGGPHDPPCSLFLIELDRRDALAEAAQIGVFLHATARMASAPTLRL